MLEVLFLGVGGGVVGAVVDGDVGVDVGGVDTFDVDVGVGVVDVVGGVTVVGGCW